MPTPKQVRYHYGRVYRLQRELARALTDAHNAGVLQYDKYDEESPCKSNFETEDRVWNTMKEMLAKALATEIEKPIRQRWYR